MDRYLYVIAVPEGPRWRFAFATLSFDAAIGHALALTATTGCRVEAMAYDGRTRLSVLTRAALAHLNS